MTTSEKALSKTTKHVIALLVVVLIFQLMYAVLEWLATLNDGMGIPLDSKIMAVIGTWHTPWLNSLFIFITHTGDIFLIIPVAAMFFWLWRRKERVTAVLLIISTVTAPIISLVLKAQVQRPRPQVFPPLVEESTASFPSGHTLTAVASYGFIAVALWQRGHRGLAVVSALWGLLVSFSRIYLGAHYPTDVLASIIYGITYLIIIFLVDALIRNYQTQKKTVDPASRPEIIPAPRGKRLLSIGITLIVIGAMFVPALLMLSWAMDDPLLWRWLVTAVFFLTAIAGMAVHDVWFVGHYGGSIGDRWLGLRIVCYDDGKLISYDRATIRWGVGVAATVLLLSGFLAIIELGMILFRKDRRHIRDMISGTMVTTDRDAPAATSLRGV